MNPEDLVNHIHNEEAAVNVADADALLDQLFELSLTLAGLVERWLSEHGLTRARAHVLWLLRHYGPVTQRMLAQALGVTPRNVTGLLDALEASGHVARTAHPTDRRATLVTLTSTGNAATAALQAGHREFARVLFGDIPGTDLSRFSAVADHVITRLRDTDLGAIAEVAAGQPPADPGGVRPIQ